MKKVFYIITTLFLINIGINSANALGSSITSTKATVGGSVIVTVNGSGYAGNFFITSSNGGVLSGGGNDWIENGTKTYKFTAKSVGTATITVKGTAASFATGTDENYSKSYTVTVGAKPVVTLSKDNTLKELSVEGKELSPAFSKDNLEYKVELDPDITSINIIATANNGGATIKGNGTVEVQDGDNRLEIVVTAENGDTKTYIINANVKELDPVQIKINGKEYTVVRKKSALGEINGYTETTVDINGNEIPALKSDVTGYTIVALKDEKGTQNYYIKDKDNYILYKEYTFNKVVLCPLPWNKSIIPKGYKKYTITYNDEKIDVYKYKKNSKYALIYGVNVETGVENIYMYDSVEDTIQIYNEEEINTLRKQNSLYLKGLIGVSVLSVILIIMIIVIITKNKKKHSLKVKQMNV